MQRLKFSNILGKKLKDLELLGQSLVYKEKQVLQKYQDQLEEHDLEENLGHYEKKGLLDNSSDDEFDSDGEERKQSFKKNNYQQPPSSSSSEDEEDEEPTVQIGGQQVVLQKPRLTEQATSLQEYVEMRGERINRVQNSLVKIHKMYQTLNEIVVE